MKLNMSIPIRYRLVVLGNLLLWQELVTHLMGSRLLVVVEVHVRTMKPYRRGRGIVPLIPNLSVHGGEQLFATWLLHTGGENSEFPLIVHLILRPTTLQTCSVMNTVAVGVILHLSSAFPVM